MAEKFTDSISGESFETPNGLIDHYISHFVMTIKKATGAEIAISPLDEDGFTSVKRGSATVGINVDIEGETLILISKIMKLPEKNPLDCMKLLLELNFTSMSGAAFAIDKKDSAICIISRRDVANLDYAEFEDMLHSVASLADEWDDRLVEMFA
ncbi:MAG: YbjN domain-containing protein [Deltaproteobacteria bacterium]|nr:YbjN domain-containing protein [Deltaproteobacteria bacterium]